MTVAGSTLFDPATPTSVDTCLKYCLLNYFPEDVQLEFAGCEVAFGDSRGMRPVEPTPRTGN